MTKRFFSAFLTMTALAVGASVSAGCVSDRPSRNGVFNENQYVRKSFLVRDADGSTTDTGWLLKATVTQTSSPNPLGDTFGIFPGAENGGALVRFRVTQDKLQMLNMREVTEDPSEGRTEEVVNSWPITNVDLKYRVNLDGETTNFYEENQELDWQVRQWVKINFAKNDASDVAPFGPFSNDLLSKCADLANASTTLVPGSFYVDESHDYMQWVVNITLPLHWDDETCLMAYGFPGQSPADAALRLGRYGVTFNLMYSLTRATPPDQITYPTWELDEKDPIQHKYGPFTYNTVHRDSNSGQLVGRSLLMRWDPNKDITWYFTQDFPEDYKKYFRNPKDENDPTTVQGQTNRLFAESGAKARLHFKNYDEDLEEGQPPRQYGDVRYSFLRWLKDRDMQSFWAGVTQFVNDPRTGEILTSSISFNDFAIKDYYVARINAYLASIGACPADYDATKGVCCHHVSDANGNDVCVPDQAGDVLDDGDWGDPTNAAPSGQCNVGDTVPLIPQINQQQHNGTSSLYTKMQSVLLKPQQEYGPLGPQDFIVQHTDPASGQEDKDFYRAYFSLMPYYFYADPDMNPWVTREGGAGILGPGTIWQQLQDEAEFYKTTAKIDRGEVPFDDLTGPQGLVNATSFMNRLRQLQLNHKSLGIKKPLFYPNRFMDTPEGFSFESVMKKDARHCVADASGATHWETKQEWVKSLIDTYWSQVIWHEFGHSLGLEHNFAASVDRPNWPERQHFDGTSCSTDADCGSTDRVCDTDQASPKAGTCMSKYYGLYASSVMEYNAAPDRVFWQAGWAPYDRGALGFIYANMQNKDDKRVATDPSNPSTALSGEQATVDDSGKVQAAPWRDPEGFYTDAQGNLHERQFLFCSHQHLQYSPFCRQGDMGVTPSEIIANQIESYEWQYKWRNFRTYRKLWNEADYAGAPAGIIMDMRKFLSTWVFDWSSTEIADSLRRIGVQNPDPNGSDQDYYAALGDKFNHEASTANQLVAAFHNALIQQSTGERPVRTIYDKYYGDVTQQGIILDKLFAMEGWVALWPTDNYDQNQAGVYLASYEGLGDPSYDYISQSTANFMIGGQYDAFPYFTPLAVAQFAQDTHSPSFFGANQVRDWIGGHVFTRLDDFLSFFRDKAVQNNYVGPGCGPNTECDCANANSTVDTCKYDPRDPNVSDSRNVFTGPDKRIWIWTYLEDRNEWIAVQKERNSASYIILFNYNDDVVNQLDDGAYPGNAYNLQLPLKYVLDSFNYYN